MLTLRSRLILLGILLLARTAFGAAGEYQQTRDGRTTVWNASPKPGETASWAGGRDKEGYANGFGTITWYDASGTVYAVYYGNMVNGKLEGPVNMHMGRRTAHAYFADGSRVTAWAHGPAPSKMNVPQELVAKRRKAESEQPKARDERAQARKETTEQPAQSSEIATETTPKKPKPEPEKIRAIEHAAQKPQEKPASPETAAVQSSAEAEHRESTEQPVNETPKESPAVPETTTVSTPEPAQSASPPLEPPKIAESQETPKPFASEPPQVPTPEPAVEEKPETAQQAAATEPPEKSGVDGSLSALTGPPSSLRSSPMSESPAPTKTTSRPSSSGTRGVAQLNEEEAIGLADVEARSRGYDLNEYQRPKADYSAVKDKWTLFYNLKDAKMAGGDFQPFSVTVEDKTKKVEIRRNY